MTRTTVSVHKNKRFSIISGTSLIFLVAMLVVNIFPMDKIDQKPFFINEGPLVIAHQGGELLAPSNTMAAFRNAVELGVDVLETDIHITKDGHLVTIHDSTVDRTTNGKGNVSDYTLKELQRLDAGYQFKDLEGNSSFKNKGVYIPTVEELFQTFPNIRIEIEIKDDNPAERIEEICEKLWDLIKKYNMEDKILIASFDQQIINMFEKYSKGRVAVASGKQEVTKFVIFHKFFLRNLYEPKVDVFQIPTKESIFNLTDKKLIEGAHRRGQQIHYWTIDNEAEMKRLLNLGADGILTNRPDLLVKVLNNN